MADLFRNDDQEYRSDGEAFCPEAWIKNGVARGATHVVAAWLEDSDTDEWQVIYVMPCDDARTIEHVCSRSTPVVKVYDLSPQED